MLLPLAFPDARHVHLVPAEHVKLIIIEHTGSVVQKIRKILCHWSKKEKKGIIFVNPKAGVQINIFIVR